MSARPNTRRIRAGLIETELGGRVGADMIVAMAADYRKLGGRSTWLVDAAGATAYASDAISRAVDEFAKLQREAGLDRIVAIVEKPLVRMGATVVAASLRTLGSPLEIRVVADRKSAEAALAANK